MPNKFAVEDFKPVHLKRANTKLDKHVLSASLHQKTNDEYKKSIFKESLWRKLMNFFRK